MQGFASSVAGEAGPFPCQRGLCEGLEGVGDEIGMTAN